MAEPAPGGDPGIHHTQRRVPDPGAVARPWLDVYPPGVPPTYTLPHVPVTRLLDDAARDLPDTPSVVVDGHTLDHAAVAGRVDTLARALATLGIRPGDVVGIAVPRPSLTAVLLVWAIWRVGAVLLADEDGTGGIVPDVLIGTRRGAHGWLQNSEGSRQGADAPPGGRMDAVRDGVGVLPRIVVRVTGDEWPELTSAPGWWRRSGSLDAWRGRRRRGTGHADDSDEVRLVAGLDEARRADASGIAAASLPPVPAPDAPALLLPADGGQLRRLDHAALVANAFHARLWVPDVQAGRERVLVTGSIVRGPGLTFGLLATMLAAGTLEVVDARDADTIARTIQVHRPTMLVADAEHLIGLTQLAPARHDLGSLRVVWTGRELEPAVMAVLEQRTAGARVRYGFGFGEGTLVTHGQPVYGRVVPGAIGLPVTDTVAAVVDPSDTGQARPPGHAGLLAVHGPQLGHDDTGSRWWITDDVVAADTDGWFRRLGHRDEVLQRDGEVVALTAVETTLESHPAVRAAGAVIGAGRTLEVGVVLRRRQRPARTELMAHCAETLGPNAVPDRLEVVDELPRTGAGAIDRVALRQQLAAGDSA